MADVDNKNPSPNDPTQAIQGVKSELDAKLAEVQEQLKAMNAQFAESLQTLASAVKPPAPPKNTRITDDDVFNPESLQEKVNQQIETATSEALRKERELNATIYNLTQEYPELQVDSKVKAQLIEQHNKLPKRLQGTPEGYEMAALKVAQANALLPKSKRQTLDEDIGSSGIRGGESAPQRSSKKSKKISDETLEFAALIGRPTDDPEYQKRLEGIVNDRDTWTKYR